MENNKINLLLVVLISSILFIFNAWFFFVKGDGSWEDRIKLPLKILTVYTIAFGFLSTTDILKDFGNITRDMTDPNFLKFLVGNSYFFSLLFETLYVAFSEPKTHYQSKWTYWYLELQGAHPSRKKCFSMFYPFETLFLFALMVTAFVYSIFHFLFVIPISYLAYAMVSVPIRAIQNANRDVAISSGGKTITVKQIFSSENEVAMRNFLISIPAIVLQIIIPMLLNVAST